MTGRARAQVLELLAAGEITVEQADQLLDALEATDPSPEDVREEPEQDEREQVKRFIRKEVLRRNPDFDQLIGLAVHGVTPGFIRDLRSAGLENLTTDEVVELAVHGVEPGYVRKVRTLGWDVRPRDIVQLAIHGIDAEYLERLRDLDIDLDVEQLVELGIHNVEPDVVLEWSRLRRGEKRDARVRVERTVNRRRPGAAPMPPRPPAPPARPAPPAPSAPTAPNERTQSGEPSEAAPRPQFHDGTEVDGTDLGGDVEES